MWWLRYRSIGWLSEPEQKDVQVEWKKWEVTKIEIHTVKGHKKIKKRTLEKKEGTLQKLLNEIKTEAALHTEHLFNKEWQHLQFKECRDKLGKNDVLSVVGFFWEL